VSKVSSAVALFVAVLAVAGCGGGDGAAETVRVEGTEYAYVTPGQIEGGVVSMEFANTGEELHEYAMGRLAPGKTFADFRRELEDGGEEGPSSSVDVGGVPLLSPGEEVTITRRLEPGTHVLVCFVPTTGGNTHFDEGMVGSFVVDGDSDAELPEADGAIVAREDSYDVPDLEAGTKTIELRNEASDPREFNLLRLNPGKTIADAEKWFESGNEGPAPLAFVGAMQSIPASSSVFLTLDFESGQRYVVFEEENGFRAEVTVK
jgi:uncharacterized cupredoxin-like copper-binding protein